MILRTGRKVGRTIYEQRGAQPSDDDQLVGVMDTAVLARHVVDRWNTAGALICALCGLENRFHMLSVWDEHQREAANEPADNDGSHAHG